MGNLNWKESENLKRTKSNLKKAEEDLNKKQNEVENLLIAKSQIEKDYEQKIKSIKKEN